MTSIWFVTPAWQREQLTAVCLEQRQRVIEQLASWDIEAHCVVIADDGNVDTARQFGFDVVEQDNTWLGRKFNDGIQYAVEQGATWVVPIGSDSWIDPWYFRHLPPDDLAIVRTSQLYAPVEADRLAVLRVASPRNPAGPHVFHRDLLKRAGYRPMPDQISRNTDSNTVRALSPFRWQQQEVHSLQYIGFRAPPFITQYALLWQRWGVRELLDPWAQLARHYDSDLVARARQAMGA
jgi:glycosyltransferase involved in cell wall biosynthesis